MVRQCLRLPVITFLVLLAGWLAGSILEAQDPASKPGASAQSPRNANYTVDTRLDPETRALEGRTVLTWRNTRDQPTDELRFHLYWNAWRNNRSSWMGQRRLDFRPRSKRKPLEDSWSWIEVDNVRLLPSPVPEETTTKVAVPEDGGTEVGEPIDLNGALDYLAPDDGNPDDRTVMRVRLPRTVAPGETIVVELDWRARVPRTFARTGFRGDYFFVAHWFPKLGVYEDGGTWNCHQFWTTTEFFSDYGNYDVSMTVPDDFVVGATGREVEKRDNGDGTVTHRYVQEDVHGFTWTTSPDYVVQEERFEKPGLPSVDMRLLLQPEHLDQAERYFAATSAALEHYGTWYGPYPYEQITIIDPAYGSGTGGMEYPTLFTAGTSVNNPVGGGSPEGVTIHEAGHQFWYGLVGNNEFEHAWLDEGLNTFSTARAYDVTYGERLWKERFFKPPGIRFAGFFAMLFDDVRLSRDVYGNRLNRSLKSGVEQADPQSTPSCRYFPATSGRLSYDRTAQWLATLEKTPRVGHAARDSVDVLRTLPFRSSRARGLLRRRQRGLRSGPFVVLRSGPLPNDSFRLLRRLGGECAPRMERVVQRPEAERCPFGQ